MPITYITFLIGALALAAIPPFAGFYSKDAIIEAVGLTNIPGADYAYTCLLLGTFVTALYIFRAFFLTFHTTPRFDKETAKHLRESPFVVTMPLVILAVSSVFLGAVMAYAMLYDVRSPLLGNSVFVAPAYQFFSEMAGHYRNNLWLIVDACKHLPCWFSIAGILTAWVCYVKYPTLPASLSSKFTWFYLILRNKYGFDAFNDKVFVKGSRVISNFFFNVADIKLIDSMLVDGSGRGIAKISAAIRRLQSGYVYHYALALIVGLFAFLVWIIFL